MAVVTPSIRVFWGLCNVYIQIDIFSTHTPKLQVGSKTVEFTLANKLAVMGISNFWYHDCTEFVQS